MVPLVVPEEDWGPTSWAVTHPLYVESQIEYGLDEAALRLLGASARRAIPRPAYREYGVDVIGMDTTPGLGYTSDHDELTAIDYGWDDTRSGLAGLRPTTDDDRPTTGRAT